MHLTPIQLRAALTQALAALEAAGVPAENVVLGFTNTPRDDEDTAYETHVGAGHELDTASLVHLVAEDLAEEAGAAAVALTRREQCTRCGSPRWRFRQRRRPPRRGQPPGIYIETFDECMDCGERGPSR